jgi:sodium-dependent dicarboxylate transporter 2/3/5
MPLLRILLARRWLIVGLLVGLVVVLLPPPDGLSPQGMRSLALLATAIIFLVTEPIPLPATALLIAVGQVVLGLGEPNAIARSFMSDAVFFIMGSLMISVALVKHKLDVRIAFGLMRLAGPHTIRIAFGLAAISALLASFIGQHTVAAMMLPVALGILGAAERDRPGMRNLGALLLLSIAYGSAIASLGTPSGGARNVILIDYWRQMFDIQIDYATWMLYAYPLVLLQIPFVPLVLLSTFRPETLDLRRALVRLRAVVVERGRFSRRDLQVVVIFLVVLLGWVTLGDRFGLGMIAIAGASLYLITGLVRWEDLNVGVNWGVVWLYAAAISLGFQLKATGAAPWLAENLLALLGNVQGVALLLVISGLMVLFAGAMGGGAAVAVVAPITIQMAAFSQESLIAAGFVTAISSAFAYQTVIGAPSSMIIHSSGYLSPKDYLRAGSKLLVVSIILLLLVATFYWPWLGLDR